MKTPHFPYEWNLGDGYPAAGVEHHGTTVMSTFACGGGSTMGYKLAGYDVVAANDIDPRMADVYQANHHPKQFFLGGVRELLERDDLPQVDVLDGSPPCSVFSTAGDREAAWQKNKKFREGQASQVLDDLFFDFLELVQKMQPKIVIAENVRGMLASKAKWYTREVCRRFKSMGYDCQVFLLNAATMGVPQRRERVFFIAHRTGKSLEFRFNEPPILFSEVSDPSDTKRSLTDVGYKYWLQAAMGTPFGKFRSRKKLHYYRVANTIAASDRHCHPLVARKLNKLETSRIGSWPLDYDFCGVDYNYLIGMSVPPVMMAQIAHQVYLQLIKQQEVEHERSVHTGRDKPASTEARVER